MSLIDPIVIEGRPRLARGPKPYVENAGLSKPQKQRSYRQRKGETKKRHIAILDMETDPFDDKLRSEILPFVCELYSDQFAPIVIWDENFDVFIIKLTACIEALPDAFTIYAHNGGKFDFMFLVSKLRGIVKFKGRAIMSARIGEHELRDSLHILPEKLAAWKKDHFDYSKMTKKNRNIYRTEILAYLHSDCVYLFDIVKSFVDTYGFKISIGQAAFGELKKSYTVSRVTEQTDEFMRRYFFGGRVECLQGRKHVDCAGNENYKMFDVNSMYPAVMANYKHPIGNSYNWRRGNPSGDTFFIDVECRNRGAFVKRLGDGEISSPNCYDGRERFYTTIWEYNAALKYNLISDVEIVGVVDCLESSSFDKFIIPTYNERLLVKAKMGEIQLSRPMDYFEIPDWQEFKKRDLFCKYLLNNSFGKFAQNPRKFKEYYYTDEGDAPPPDWFDDISPEYLHETGMPVERCAGFAVWAKPSPGRRFNNVGTAASITGAARAVLMSAIQGAIDPIYCDTDSLIARDLTGVEIHKSKLGAWDLEEQYDEIIIAGKKLYACKVRGFPNGHDKRIKVRCKGAPGATWGDFEKMMQGEIIQKINPAPTLTRTGKQYYMKRNIRATAQIK